jgi:hypothetical protein
MKYQILSGGWPCGQHLIPAGTIIDTTSNDQWSTLVKHLRPPLNAMPLTKATWLWMKKLHPGETHQILTPPGKER